MSNHMHHQRFSIVLSAVVLSLCGVDVTFFCAQSRPHLFIDLDANFLWQGGKWESDRTEPVRDREIERGGAREEKEKRKKEREWASEALFLKRSAAVVYESDGMSHPSFLLCLFFCCCSALFFMFRMKRPVLDFPIYLKKKIKKEFVSSSPRRPCPRPLHWGKKGQPYSIYDIKKAIDRWSWISPQMYQGQAILPVPGSAWQMRLPLKQYWTIFVLFLRDAGNWGIFILYGFAC